MLALTVAYFVEAGVREVASKPPKPEDERRNQTHHVMSLKGILPGIVRLLFSASGLARCLAKGHEGWLVYAASIM